MARVTMVEVRKSKRPGKKFQAGFDSGKAVHFGAAGMSDYTKKQGPPASRGIRRKTRGQT